jgi:hypothetical protein
MQPDTSPATLDTVATPRSELDPERRHRRLRLAALLLLLASVLGVSAVFRIDDERRSALPPTDDPLRVEVPSNRIPERLIARVEPPQETQAETSAAVTPDSISSPPPPVESGPVSLPKPPVAESRSEVRAETAIEPVEPQPAQPVVLTPVTILYKHRGGPAFLSIYLDGNRLWNQELKPAEGRIQKLTGYGTRAVIAVPPGTHTLEVNLRDPERGVDAIQAIRSRYTNGKRRTLRVSVDPKDNLLQLRWKE